ncbi:helix-turn-helix domain-containing protein [Actinoplanes sp. CA-030573]|uniref:helix-turn-helix domain-containing protein n=1 Tax=Actinoplanes sp. CA-030573 TaxID=3239898 RepID=UPI003D8CA1AD
MADPQAVRAAWHDLGQLLAEKRRASGLSQQALAAQTNYSRSSIGSIETGIQHVNRAFWSKADDLLHAKGELVAGYHAAEALQREHQRPTQPAGESNATLFYSSSRPHELPESADKSQDPYPSPTSATEPRSENSWAALRQPYEVRGSANALARIVDSLVVPRTWEIDIPQDVSMMAAAVAALRDSYQHSRYGWAAERLPYWISVSDALMRDRSGGAVDERFSALAAAVYQVTSGVLLKLDSSAMAALAAERSAQAAAAGGNPLVIASSARAQVHTLLASQHSDAAVSLALASAQNLEKDLKPTDAALSIRGALVLRAAAAAARDEDRRSCHSLLEEATEIGKQLGRDDNLGWTAFGPTNVLLHKVSTAVDLGDAGTALDIAAGIDISSIMLPERRAMIYIDSARALLQWGKFERAFEAIRAAEEHAPEEVRQRSAVHGMIEDLARRSSTTLRRRVQSYCLSIGMAA